MSDGQHGLQPDGHGHVYCEHCNAHGVHIDQEKYRRTGDIEYDAHERKGSTVDCRGRGKPVPAQYRRGLRVASAA